MDAIVQQFGRPYLTARDIVFAQQYCRLFDKRECAAVILPFTTGSFVTVNREREAASQRGYRTCAQHTGKDEKR